MPSTLHQLWTAPSPKTTTPLVVAGSVVTGDGHEVDGRDPATGKTLWSYARDLELCGVTWVYHVCGRGVPGRPRLRSGQHGRRQDRMRGSSRSAYADPHVTLSSDGTTVLAAGDSRLELWRSDMVRMLGYGALDARIKPGVPPAPLCRLVSAAASSSAVSVLEACPRQAICGSTLLRPADEEDQPDLKYVPQPGVADGTGARVVAVSDTTTAVYVPTPKPMVEHRRRNRRDDRQHATVQAAVGQRDDVARRRPDHMVDRRQPDGVLRQRTSLQVHRRAVGSATCRWGLPR